MKRGHITVFLTVLLVAAIAVFAAFSGPSITGLSGNSITGMAMYNPKEYTSTKPLPASERAFCGKSCLSDSQCGTGCGSCSPSLGRCVEGKRPTLESAFSWQNYERCRRTCRERQMRCQKPLKASDETGYQVCEVNLGRCYDSCITYHNPAAQPTTCFSRPCTSGEEILTVNDATLSQCYSVINPCKSRCYPVCKQSATELPCKRACMANCVGKKNPACKAYLPP